MSLGGKAIGGTLSSINESLGGSHCAEQWQKRWPTGRSKCKTVNLLLSTKLG